MNKIVCHQSIKNNWLDPKDIKNPKTLVLGSFNPFESVEKSVDYYYGRDSNHFWSTIALIIRVDKNYFFDPICGFKRKKEIMKERFCCLDVINSIKLTSESEEILNLYLKNEIYSGFSDQKIWAGYTDFQKRDRIYFSREYNSRVIDFLNNNTTIKKVIHTMGMGRILESGAKPKEKKLKSLGFNSYCNEIKDICKKNGIEFVYESWSPSGYAINRRSTNPDTLKKWLMSNIDFC